MPGTEPQAEQATWEAGTPEETAPVTESQGESDQEPEKPPTPGDDAETEAAEPQGEDALEATRAALISLMQDERAKRAPLEAELTSLRDEAAKYRKSHEAFEASRPHVQKLVAYAAELEQEVAELREQAAVRAQFEEKARAEGVELPWREEDIARQTAARRVSGVLEKVPTKDDLNQTVTAAVAAALKEQRRIEAAERATSTAAQQAEARKAEFEKDFAEVAAYMPGIKASKDRLARIHASDGTKPSDLYPKPKPAPVKVPAPTKTPPPGSGGAAGAGSGGGLTPPPGLRPSELLAWQRRQGIDNSG